MFDKFWDYITKKIKIFKDEEKNVFESGTPLKSEVVEIKEPKQDYTELIVHNRYSREAVHDIFSPETKFQSGCGAWGLHGIIRLPGDDYIFFVTYGSEQSGHTFQEGISDDGKLIWQSQPQQGFESKDIKKFINHDPSKNNIYLFRRNSKKEREYEYLGKLKYLSHDPYKEKPVWFTWQIIDWSETKVPENTIRVDNNKDDKKNDDKLKRLKAFIEKMFSSLDTNFITYNSIYAKMAFTEEDLFDEFEIDKKPQVLFEIIKDSFPEYYYDDQFVGKDPIPPLDEIIIESIKNEDDISYEKVKRICDQMVLDKLYNKAKYMMLIEKISDEYYMLNNDGLMVKKEKFNLPEAVINNTRDILRNLLKITKAIDLNSFNGYKLFQNNKYTWNKYLLKIVVEKYLSNEMCIENDKLFLRKENYNG